MREVIIGLRGANDRLRRENDQLKRENGRLRGLLGELEDKRNVVQASYERALEELAEQRTRGGAVV